MQSRNVATYTSQQRFSAPQCTLRQKMNVGMPTEQSGYESRVSMTPQTVQEFVLNHHNVFVQTNAGMKAGFTDEEYTKAGARIVKTIEEVYQHSEMILKVLAPSRNEFSLIKSNHIVMAWFNFNHSLNNETASNRQTYNQMKEIYDCMTKSKATFIDYENIENDFGMRPLVQPLSEIAGHLAIQQGMKYLEKQMGGSGVLLGKIAGVQQSEVLVLGAGVAGLQAARIAAATGAHVTLMDISSETLRQVKDTLPMNVDTQYLSQENINKNISRADLVIGAVIPLFNQYEQFLVTRKQVESMKRGSVIVDLAMWWGGNFETSKATTMEAPTFMCGGIVHFCATNIFLAVPKYASEAFSTAVLPLALQIANKNWQQASVENNCLMNGMTVVNGQTTNEFLARTYNTEYFPVEILVKKEIELSNKSTNDLIQLKQQLHQFQTASRKTQFTIEA